MQNNTLEYYFKKYGFNYTNIKYKYDIHTYNINNLTIEKKDDEFGIVVVDKSNNINENSYKINIDDEFCEQTTINIPDHNCTNINLYSIDVLLQLPVVISSWEKHEWNDSYEFEEKMIINDIYNKLMLKVYLNV